MSTGFDPIWVALTEISSPPCDGAFEVSPKSRAAARATIDTYLRENPDVNEGQLWQDFREREKILEARTPIPDIVLAEGLVLAGTETVRIIEAEQPGIFEAMRGRRS
ncbi:MAG: hypothetical protein WA152_01865 [Microgenomates group bacterium]